MSVVESVADGSPRPLTERWRDELPGRRMTAPRIVLGVLLVSLVGDNVVADFRGFGPPTGGWPIRRNWDELCEGRAPPADERAIVERRGASSVVRPVFEISFLASGPRSRVTSSRGSSP